MRKALWTFSRVMCVCVCHKQFETNLKQTLLFVQGTWSTINYMEPLSYQLPIAIWIRDQLSSLGSNSKYVIILYIYI